MAETVINTYDPTDYVVTIHPLLGSLSDPTRPEFEGINPEFKEFWSDNEGVPIAEITEFAPGEPFSASINKDKIVSHKGVNGEILRTFLSNRKGTVTMNLLSAGKQAEALIAMFIGIEEQDYVQQFNKSPISSIRVGRKTAEGTKNILVATDCWLVKDPDWSLSENAFYAALIFDCTSVNIKHG
jgi:hypothetical protein